MQLSRLSTLFAGGSTLQLLCLMLLSDLSQSMHLERASKQPAGEATHQDRPPTPEASASAMLAALADINTARGNNSSELTAIYLMLIQRFLDVRGAFTTQFGADTITIDLSRSTDWELPLNRAIPLKASFCQLVQATGTWVAIPDALQDTRVANVAMQRDFDIRAYLGVPLRTADGKLYGTLCAVDTQPHTFSQIQIDLLRIVAGQIAFVIDRQQSVGAERQAADNLNMALRALDEQATLLRVVAHDMRTPLTSISGFVELLQQYTFGPISVAQQEALDRIKLAIMLITRLTNDLVDALAIETQELALLPEAIDPYLVALNVLETCRPLAAGRDLTLNFRGTANLPQIVGDPDRVRQVLFNLLSNALRYTPKGSVALIVDLYQEMVEFRVEDTGPGIPEDQQEQIWKPYARATTHGNGLGLGLYVVRRLVHAMGGSTGMRSTIGQGSAFWVRLPCLPRVQAVGEIS